MFAVNDYVEGTELYDGEFRRVKGWVTGVGSNTSGDIVLYVQVDDEFGGRRTLISSAEGEIVKLDFKDLPLSWS